MWHAAESISFLCNSPEHCLADLQVAFVTGNLKLRLNVEQNPVTRHVSTQPFPKLI